MVVSCDLSPYGRMWHKLKISKAGTKEIKVALTNYDNNKEGEERDEEKQNRVSFQDGRINLKEIYRIKNILA